jgi:hypothetical protein
MEKQMKIGKSLTESVNIAKFIKAIERLPSDKPQIRPGIWYKTQKQHWLGWLKEYHGPGAYGRNSRIQRDAEFAYNHIVNYKMLTWIAKAAGVSPELVRKAEVTSARAKTLMGKSAAVRKLVPWQLLRAALFRH